MKQLTSCKTILSVIILMIFAPGLGIAQPPNPGGTDPFATPVNGGVVFVVIIAFIYGGYRVYQITKKARAANIDR